MDIEDEIKELEKRRAELLKEKGLKEKKESLEREIKKEERKQKYAKFNKAFDSAFSGLERLDKAFTKSLIGEKKKD